MLSEPTPGGHIAHGRRESRLLWLAFAFLSLAGLTIALAAGLNSLASVQHLVVLPVWGLAAWLIHRTADRYHPLRDPYLLPIAMLLAGWGLLMVWRLSPGLGSRQTLWLLLGAAAMVLILRGPPGLEWLRRYRYLWLLGGILLTAMTLVFGTNPAGGEPRLWLGCCGVFFQPSEPLRLLLVAFVASYLADRKLVGRPASFTRDFIPLFLAAALAALLLFAQRDLGSATLFLAVLAFMIYVAYGHPAVLIGAGLLALLSAIVAHQMLDIVQVRFEAWLSPWVNASDSGYQVVQSLIAVASGGVFGLGPGLGAPTLVPVVQSDFVFSAVAEEWGMFGALAMIVLFALLVGRSLRTAARRKEPFAVLLSAGIAIAIGLQAILIVGGVLRLLPITGVTLPFISYGGSSLVTSFVGLAFIVLLSRARLPGAGQFARPVLNTQILLSVGWAAIALSLGWWAIIRAEALTTRTDNLRRGLGSLVSPRGMIMDRNGSPLVSTVGQAGEYQRSYDDPVGGSVTGYDSLAFGQAGIERYMDPYLRGEIGPSPLEIWWSKLVYGVPPAGSDVRLTVDGELQRAAAKGLEGLRGAVVVLDAVTGDVLASASAPSYDPNRLDEEWPELVARVDAPLLNRVVQGSYQPGMAVTPLLYAWSMAEDLIDPGDAAPEFSKAVELFDRTLTCPATAPSGSWSEALENSCAGPFVVLGERLGPEGISQAFAAFGLTAPLDIRLTSAQAQPLELADDPQTLGLEAIGQGELTVTPLQMARAYAVLTGAGVRPSLTIVDAYRPKEGEWQLLSPLGGEQVVLSPTEAQVTLDALSTYSSEFIGYEVEALSGEEPVAWFIGIGPAGRLVVVLIEDAEPAQARELGLGLLELVSDLDLAPPDS
ncbi:MAG: FtsW/RodA/SpoVE family cell cycle protein [Anaerolineales bacterium]